MAKSLITQTLGVRGLIEISDKIARLSEAGYAFGKKLRELEHQFDAAAFFLREAYLGDVLRSTGPSRNYRPRPRSSLRSLFRGRTVGPLRAVRPARPER